MPLAPGTRLGAYVIKHPLGSGAMGEVYRAHDARLARDVAIKVLPEHLSTDPDALARFEREMKTIGALSHPNIVAIFDVGHDGAIAYAVTELLEGETLGAVAARGAVPARKAIDYGVQVARALAAAHERGIVSDAAGMLHTPDLFLSADAGTYVYGFTRLLSTLYLANGLQ